MAEFDELGLTEEELKQLQESDIPADEPAKVESPPEPEVTPEQIEQKEQEVAQMQQQKMVPLAALQEARAELRQMRQQMQMVDALRNEILTVKQQLQPKVEEPKYEEDPFGAIKHDLEALKQANAQRDALTMQILQQEQLKQQQRQFADYIVQDEQSVRQQFPDFDQAFAHLVSVRTKELETLGIHEPQEIAQYLQQDALRATTQAMRAGQSPSLKVYELARVYGYNPQPVQQTQPEPQNGQQKARDEFGRFASVQAGQQAAKTLQGGVTTGNVTADMLLDPNLSTDDFNKMWGEIFPESKRTFL